MDKVYPDTPKIGAKMVRQWQADGVYTVENLVSRWQRLSERDKATARMWFPLMNLWDRSVALRYSRPVLQVHGINAVLSQSTGLDLNLELVIEYLEGRPGHRRSLYAHDKVMRILAGEDPVAVVSGPKIECYFESIVSSGESMRVCCDRWQGRAPFEGDTWREYTTPRHAISDTAYPLIERMHVDAADIVGEKPEHVQPGLWKEIRGAFASIRGL